MEEFKELFLTSISNLTEQMAQMGSRLEDLSTQVLLVQNQVEVLNTQTPAQGREDRYFIPTTFRAMPPIYEEGHTEDAMDEAFTDAAEEDNASNSDRDGLQLLLQQFARSQREERRLRTQEFQAMMGMLSPNRRCSS